MKVTERIYVITLKKIVIDIREKNSKINEILKLVGNVGFYVWYDDGINPDNFNPIFLKTRIGKPMIARYKVPAIGPVEAIKKILKDNDDGKDDDKKPIKTGALQISLDRIIEIPECNLLKDENGNFFCVSKYSKKICKVEMIEFQNCILAYEEYGDGETTLKTDSIVEFYEENIVFEKQTFTILRSKSS